jgi:hypothetical protein
VRIVFDIIGVRCENLLRNRSSNVEQHLRASAQARRAQGGRRTEFGLWNLEFPKVGIRSNSHWNFRLENGWSAGVLPCWPYIVMGKINTSILPCQLITVKLGQIGGKWGKAV